MHYKPTKHLVNNRCELFDHPLQACLRFAENIRTHKPMETNHAAFAQLGGAVLHNTCNAAAALENKHRQGRMGKLDWVLLSETVD